MRLPKKLLAGVAATIVITSAALAADVIVVPPPPPPPPPLPPPSAAVFEGLYIGGIGGLVHGNKFWDNTPYGAFGTTEHKISGILIGGEVGFRFQPGAFAFGAEADIAWTNANGSGICGPAATSTCATDLDWLATFTGTFGFVPGAVGGNILIYGEAGLAFAGENFEVTDPGLAGPLTGTLGNSGFVLGGGAVFAMANGLYVKSEYNFINFGTDGPITVTDGLGIAEDFDLTETVHVFKVGVGFQF